VVADIESALRRATPWAWRDGTLATSHAQLYDEEVASTRRRRLRCIAVRCVDFSEGDDSTLSEKFATSSARCAACLVTKSSVQFHRGPPTLTPPPSRRTAPLPSVNTSTEYSLARATQFR
jgi:hypothetical protein